MYKFGQKVTITRGRKGERPDFYATTIVSEPTLERIAGRLTRVADVISARTTLAGDVILDGPRPHDLAFAMPVRVAGQEHVEILDGPKGQPYTVNELLSKAAQATADFLARRPASVNEVSLDDVEV